MTAASLHTPEQADVLALLQKLPDDAREVVLGIYRHGASDWAGLVAFHGDEAATFADVSTARGFLDYRPESGRVDLKPAVRAVLADRLRPLRAHNDHQKEVDR